MSETEKRIKKLAELFDLIPEDRQKGIVLGIQMFATLHVIEIESVNCNITKTM